MQIHIYICFVLLHSSSISEPKHTYYIIHTGGLYTLFNQLEREPMQATKQRLQLLHNTRHTEPTNTAAEFKATLKWDQKWLDGLAEFLAYCLSRLDGHVRFGDELSSS